ncbi:uncharacterized protein NDAI_0D01160 [Naumovozyma dairenensis CBS 421]|uniref:Uncharacterized protein n=1 Tax=Naumovozyma dairenensis (strain ATCC 10597 / BCRC 20456 / CBS 421 / NBRC 0211 / NRRL Y-12639) TaxID=1071378 RepID=G0W9G8_NAUDC|nr:hypothetical protein NDAI_0D01160 [Naumovozyma dairenensis CBS 421]CCD24429.1 hypothetical protein NDAI_0D01160 [Naumovozyma dairenensis CBS 421]
MDPAKINAMVKWPIPRTAQDARRFIGLAGSYRRFVKDFSAIARLIHKLLLENRNGYEINRLLSKN